MTLVKKLQSLLTKRDKKILFLILCATIFISLLEVTTLSATMIFIGAITNFKNLANHKYAHHLFRYTGPLTGAQIILLFGSFLIIFFASRCLITFWYTYKMQKFMENRRHALTFRFFQNYLRFKFHEFTAKNPASISKLIFTDSANLMTIVANTVKIFSEFFTITLIYCSLVFINWKMTLLLTFLLCIKVMLILKTFSKKLTEQGAKAAMHNQKIGKIYNESFRNFKIVKLLNHEKHILERFKKENKGLVKAQILNQVLQETPRLLLETVGFSILVAAVIYVVYRVSTPEYIIPILSMYALAFYRFMPAMTRLMNSYNMIVYAKGGLDYSQDLMYKTTDLGNQKIAFRDSIEIKNFSFRYDPKNTSIEKNIFVNTSIKIKKQERVAFIGESGSGKSTLADIIMGFYLPQESDLSRGKIFVDGKKLTKENVKSWRNKIGYIPQQIYLFDGTVAENIVFGRTYDEQKVISALKKANIYDFLLKENGLQTKVGEGGILLSGGQMQRIAIARALYSNPEILVLDEATSALDNETETSIMQEIYSLNKEKTLIIIAHRLSTVLKCEKVYRVENQNIFLVDKKYLYEKYNAMNNTMQPAKSTLAR